MAPGVRLIGEWRKLRSALDPARVRSAMHREIEKANHKIGLAGRAFVVKSIKAQEYAPNSPLTIAMKGSSTPLFERGDLIQGITHDVPSWDRVRVGILRTRTNGAELVNVARILHEGAVIDVRKNPRVRAAVMAQLAKRLGEKRRGASKKATVDAAAQLAIGGTRPGGHLWIIPGRPFLRKPLTSVAMRSFTRERWAEAVRRALGARR